MRRFLEQFLVFVQLPNMLFQVEIPAEPLAAFLAGEWFLLVVRVHVECQIVHLMERLATDMAFEGFLPRVGQSMILIVSLLMEAFATNVAHERLVASVNAYVGVERGRSVECLAANVTLMRFLLCVNYLVSAQCARLTEAFPTNFAFKWPGAGVNRHVAGQVVVRIKYFTAHLTSECLGCSSTPLSAGR